MKKKILAVTGIRSEYDILYPVIDILRKDKNFRVKIVACGAHLSAWHGYTLKKIEEDGFEIAAKINYLFMTNNEIQRAKGTGLLIKALAHTIEKEKPDFLLVVGDREESIATAVVGNYMGILVAHIGGGDTVYGNADDPIRFAVSKLVHIHFTIAEQYAKNLIKIGEDKFRVFWTGNPGLDNIKNTPNMEFRKINNFLKYNKLGKKGYVVLIEHPLSSVKKDSYRQMKITLKAVEEFCQENKIKTIGIFPNTDPGSLDIAIAIKEHNKSKYIKFYKTLPREIFVNLIRNALALIGNSSMGFLEGPFYKLPVVNIGDRQRGRLNAGNVMFVKHNKEEIKKALFKACFKRNYRNYIKKIKNPFGDGVASLKIRDILLSIDTKEKEWYIKEKLC